MHNRMQMLLHPQFEENRTLRPTVHEGRHSPGVCRCQRPRCDSRPFICDVFASARYWPSHVHVAHVEESGDESRFALRSSLWIRDARRLADALPSRDADGIAADDRIIWHVG